MRKTRSPQKKKVKQLKADVLQYIGALESLVNDEGLKDIHYKDKEWSESLLALIELEIMRTNNFGKKLNRVLDRM